MSKGSTRRPLDPKHGSLDGWDHIFSKKCPSGCREFYMTNPPPKCPGCQKVLEEISYPGGYLNRDQWESIRAGDLWCATCPSTIGNGLGKSGAYFWRSYFY